MKIYPDIQISEGDQLLSNSREGLKCKRFFKIDKADNSDPQGTLYAILGSGTLTPGADGLPARMAPHPSIVRSNPWSQYMATVAGLFEVDNAFCADVINVKGLSSTQASVEVEYAILNAMTQEASEAGDSAPALVQIGSSVQSAKVALDIAGQPLDVPYLKTGGAAGDYKIIPSGSVSGDSIPDPHIKITTERQFPSTLIRFIRRERKPRSPAGLVGFVNNGNPWSIAEINPEFDIDEGTMLCTRIENQSDDGALSYVVTYEFAYAPLLDVPSGSIYVSPAAAISGKASPWQLNAYYVLPSGIGVDSGGALAFGQNATPPDAVPSVFQIYGQYDFNTNLALSY